MDHPIERSTQPYLLSYPSFNQGPYLEETIQSILGQHYPKLELLVIDGGSTDNSVKILEQYASHLSYWHSRKDRGQADAINQGINMSSGDVVCWLNSDDMYLPGTLLDVGRRFAGRTDTCRLVYGASVELEHGAKNIILSARGRQRPLMHLS